MSSQMLRFRQARLTTRRDTRAPVAFTTWTGTFSQANINPASPTGSTCAVSLKLTITNFQDVTGCAVGLQGSLTNRPDL